jgi:hypothetical protein
MRLQPRKSTPETGAVTAVISLDMSRSPLDGRFCVYRLTHGGLDMKREFAGRIDVLEDPLCALKELAGPLDDRRRRLIMSLARAAYAELVQVAPPGE